METRGARDTEHEMQVGELQVRFEEGLKNMEEEWQANGKLWKQEMGSGGKERCGQEK
jgi:hypothetical protein